jgi:hypothetical protein
MSALHDIVKKGSVDRSVTVRIIDSTDGTPETGVVFNTSGIDLWYRREGAVKTSITEATLATLTTAHTDGGFLAVGDGVYRLDLPDAAFTTGANYVDFGGTVTGMIVIGGRVRLVDFDLESASVPIQTVLKKNQALAKYQFLMTDSTTHNPATGKTVTVTRSIDGAAFGASTAGTATEVSNGTYYIDLSASDLNGNVVVLRATAAGCDDLFITFTMEP